MSQLGSLAAVLLTLVVLWSGAAFPNPEGPWHSSVGADSTRAEPDTGRALVAEPDTNIFPIARFVPDTTNIADTSIVFTIEVGSRLYPDWKEEHRVHLLEPFPIGDTNFSALVARFLPDFRLLDSRPVSASRRLANPAVHIFTSSDTTATDSAWAFLNFPPHFSPRAFFTFRLEEIAGYSGDPDSAAGELKKGQSPKMPEGMQK